MLIKKLSIIIPLLGYLFGQTTGKISGKITDKITSESLPGTNIYLEQTPYGTASDRDGRFSIFNISHSSFSKFVSFGTNKFKFNSFCGK